MTRRIGTLSEKSLHAALKLYIATPGDLIESPAAGYIVDIVRGDTCIEIQTRNFSNARRKLETLLVTHAVRLVYPVAAERWITRITTDGEVISRRKSPRRGTVYEMFRELVRLPALATHPRFVLDVVMIHEEQVWRDDGAGSWRRKKWSIADRRLLAVVEHRAFESLTDYLALLPDVPPTFTVSDVHQGLKSAGAAVDRAVIGKMIYCLRGMGGIEQVGKAGKAILYQRRRVE